MTNDERDKLLYEVRGDMKSLMRQFANHLAHHETAADRQSRLVVGLILVTVGAVLALLAKVGFDIFKALYA